MSDWRDWESQAACRDMSSELFFPSSPYPTENKRLTAIAQTVCAQCPVSVECGQFARTSNEGRRERFGIWNGVNHEKRPSTGMWDLKCARCEREFEYPSSKNAPPRYCSDECRRAAHVEYQRNRNRQYRGDPTLQAVGL